MKEHGVDGSRVTVIKRIEDYISPSGRHEPQWECLCECGNIFTSTSKKLRSGDTRSCGCLLKESVRNRTFKDLTGQKIGKLTVLYRENDRTYKNGYHRTIWHCVCDCGNEKDVRATDLVSGAIKSCGCLPKQKTFHLNKSLRKYDENGNLIGHVCQCCKRMLPIDNYYKDSSTADGFSWICKYCQIHSLQARYQTYKQSAKKRNLEFDLTREEFNEITSKSCYYCGDYSGDFLGEQYCGIDRVDSSIGYIKENMVPCCTTCNRMKLDHSVDEWVFKMKQILEHLNYQKIPNKQNVKGENNEQY